MEGIASINVRDLGINEFEKENKCIYKESSIISTGDSFGYCNQNANI